jgi:hypothetical protein
MALMSFREREVAWEIPGFVDYIELSGVEDFNDRFIANLGFPDLATLPDLPPDLPADRPAAERTTGAERMTAERTTGAVR